MPQRAEALHRSIHADSSLWDLVAEFCDAYPRRLSGTAVLEEGLDWIIARMKQEGWDVRTQKVMVPNWKRGKEWLRMTTRPQHAMPMAGLGGSVATNGVLKADVIVVGSFEELTAMDRSKIEGRIVVWNVPFTTYGETVKYRYGGASAAARKGAVASLVRSIGPYGMQTPHTGGMGYADDAPKIPTAAITMEDAMLMQRQQDRGERIEVELYMEAHFEPDAESRNIIIEWKGSERPDEIIVMGGHIDSWDLGTGAMDDGSGCFVTWHALNHLRALGFRPKRTIRVVFWVNEENGLKGAQEYARLTQNEKHVLAMEVDGGTFQPTGFSGTLPPDLRSTADELLKLTARVGASAFEQGEGGADTSPLHERGVPVMELTVDITRYFWYHHTEADTPDKLDPRELNDCAWVMAIMALGMADR
jgi:carboxypeptidase Q